jgi:hypothetical protein
MLLLIDLFGVCMQVYELILAGMGIVLFVAAIVFTGLKRDTKLLITMYLISLVMIAFPAISKVAFSEVTVEVQRLQCINQHLSNTPSDTILQEAARKKMETIQQQGGDTTNAATVIAIAQTNALLKDSVKALEWVEKGLRLNADNPRLMVLEKKLNTPRVQVESALKKISDSAANKASILRSLKEKTAALEKTANREADVLTTLTKANIVLGDTVKALKLADSTIRLYPQSKEAIRLKRSVSIKPVNH